MAAAPCVYVGHPLLSRLDQLRPSAEEAKARMGEPALVVVLPGSRLAEINRLGGVFGQALGAVAARRGPLDVVLPTLPHLAGQVAAVTASWPIRPRIVTEEADKFAAFRRARAALAASGTVTFELALALVPLVTAYRVSRFEWLFINTIVRVHPAVGVRSAILPNLLLGEHVVPEFLQSRCTVENIAQALSELLDNPAARRHLLEALQRLDGILGAGGAPPSERAARAVLDLLSQT